MGYRGVIDDRFSLAPAIPFREDSIISNDDCSGLLFDKFV